MFEIPALLAAVPQALGLGARLLGTASPPEPAPTPAPTSAPERLSLETSPAAREIAAGHDPRHMTPREFSELAQALHAAGAVSRQEFGDLAAMRLELDAAGLAADEPIDLTAFFSQKYDSQLEELQRENVSRARLGEPPLDAESFLASSQRWLAWIEKLAALTGSRNASLDALA